LEKDETGNPRTAASSTARAEETMHRHKHTFVKVDLQVGRTGDRVQQRAEAVHLCAEDNERVISDHNVQLISKFLTLSLFRSPNPLSNFDKERGAMLIVV
jgi:hypothetical protein